jgi:hypothetical protein
MSVWQCRLLPILTLKDWRNKYRKQPRGRIDGDFIIKYLKMSMLRGLLWSFCVGLICTHPDPVKKVIVFSWPGIIKLFLVTESLVSDIPAGDGKTITFFYRAAVF